MSQDRPDPLAWINEELAQLDRAGLRRRRATLGGRQGPRIELDGRELVSFGSNDYLALAGDPRLTRAAIEACETAGWGGGASPLVCGRSEHHRRLEDRIAQFEGTEAALLFPTGFAANAGTVGALAGRDDAIFSDSLNHASLIDGCRLSRATVHVYPHSDTGTLEQLLKTHGPLARRRLIVTDGLFSMGGDLAPLERLADLADRHDAMLLVDEAHATGVFGTHGRGIAEHLGLEDRVPIRVGTLSKALGSSGGFVAGPQHLIDWLANRARPYVFSTASPPAGAAAAEAALAIVEAEPQRGKELLDRAAALRSALQDRGWDTGPSASQIIPLVVGPAERTMALSRRLREPGFYVPGIRPPTVPKGQSQLRISLSWGHTAEMVEGLVAALGKTE